MSPSYLQLFLGASILIFLIYKSWSQSQAKKSHPPLPPGPRGDPIIGHVRLIPATRPELTYMKWGKEYNSDVLYFELLGQPAICLNSVQSAIDLLDRRGAKYSDRPNFPFYEEQGWKDTLTFANGAPFRKHRKMFQTAFTPANCVPYRPIQTDEARRTALKFIEDPENWTSHIIRFATTLVIGSAYGFLLHDDNDPYVELAKQTSVALSDGGPAGATAVDIFPLIRYLPKWLSIFPSLKFARKYYQVVRDIHELPFARVQSEMENGIAPFSFTKKMLEENRGGKHKSEEDRITDDDIKGAGGVIYSAGMDTTWSTISIFILNMVLHPEIQQKAWNEIDSVIGRERLPTFEDRSKLPFVENIVQETFRWMPVVPTGIPHVSSEDDVYKGMFIPKGSLIIPNAYAMSHDENIYKDPDTFNPDRFVDSADRRGEPVPVGHFGFGRRICPGQHLGSASVWMVIATFLSTLEFSKLKDANGREITPNPPMTTGLTSHPEKYTCAIKPRFEGAKEMLARGY